jgi:hypothetical protein
MSVKGQDWAGYQGDRPDVSGLSYVNIKATQGTSYVNPHMQAQADWARSHGLMVGFYHFQEKGNTQAQAEFFVQKCASMDGDTLWCDWETDPSTGTHPTAAEKDAFIKAVKKLRPTHRCGLYCNTSFWKTIDTTSYAGDGLWIATAGYAAGNPPISSSWVMHQYSTANGVDHDIANFSSAAAMKAWATAPQGDVMATLDAEDYANIAKAVWASDSVPAAHPPYNNGDYYKADGKTPGNTEWDSGYMQRTQVEGIRETLSRVKQLQELLIGLDPTALETALLAKIEGLKVELTVVEPS